MKTTLLLFGLTAGAIAFVLARGSEQDRLDERARRWM